MPSDGTARPVGRDLAYLSDLEGRTGRDRGTDQAVVEDRARDREGGAGQAAGDHVATGRDQPQGGYGGEAVGRVEPVRENSSSRS